MSEWQQLREKLKEYEADPLGCVVYLSELRDRCREGIDQQKVMVSKEGSMVVDLQEKYPDLELKATQEMNRIYQYVVKQSELEAKEESGNVQLEIIVTDLLQ